MKLLTAAAVIAAATFTAIVWWSGGEAAAQEEIPQRGETELIVSIENPVEGEEITATVIVRNPEDHYGAIVTAGIETPNGMAVTGTEGADWKDPTCRTYCEAKFILDPGEESRTAIKLKGTGSGETVLGVDTEWQSYAGTATDRAYVNLNVLPNVGQEPLIELHSNTARLYIEENLDVSVAVTNRHRNQPIDVVATLDMPEGTSITATYNAESCAGECKSVWERITPGEQRSLVAAVKANDPGQFLIEAYVQWEYPGSEEKGGSQKKYIVLNIARKPAPMPVVRTETRVIESDRDEGYFESFTYTKFLIGATSVAVAGVLILAGIAYKLGFRKLPGISPKEERDARVRMIAAFPVSIGIGLALTSIFAQSDDISGEKAIQLMAPGVTMIVGMGIAYRFMDLVSAAICAALLCGWGILFMVTNGRPDTGQAALTAWMIGVITLSAVAASQIVRMSKPDERRYRKQG